MKKKMTTILAAMLMSAAVLAGCSAGKKTEPAAAPTETTAAPTESTKAAAESRPETEAAANSDSKTDGNTAILVVSFGTSFNNSRDITIGAVEQAIAQAIPEYAVRRAFTAQIIIDKLKERDGLEIDNVTEALDRAVSDGVKNLIVQPTHLMNGLEYTDVINELAQYQNDFDRIAVGDPLLTSEDDYKKVAAAITDATAEYDDGETAIIFMGHGTEADSNHIYAQLQEVLTTEGFENYYIGTVEAEPSLDDVVAALAQKGTYKKVILEPLMVVAGDHANNDMAGDESDSWKTVLEGEGYEVTCLLRGLGELPAIQEIYVEHAKAAVASLNHMLPANHKSSDAGTETSSPVSGNAVADGIYEVEAESNSSMFRITKTVLHVQNGKMSAVLTLSGTGYLRLYMGTADEAAAADASGYIDYVVGDDGAYTYEIPVEALDQPLDCAAFSKKKETWYDRQIVIHAPGQTSGAAQSEKSSSETSETSESLAQPSAELTWDHAMKLDYAKLFSVDYYQGKSEAAQYALVTIDNSERYLVVPEGADVPKDLAGDISVLEQPLDHIYLAASAVMDMFVSMDALDAIHFSGWKADDWYIPEAKAALEGGNILYAGKYSAPDYEKLLAERCDLAIENTMIYHSPDVMEKLEQIGVPVLADRSSRETHPLGRTEWVKLYGALTGREKQAEQAFEAQKTIYENVAAQKENTKSLTVAYFYIAADGTVNIRKSSDYLPKMIALAGGTYIFDDAEAADASASTTTGMQMEEFYAAAKDADYIIYNSTIEGELSTLEELTAKHTLLKNLKAVQDDHVFCTTKSLYQSSMEPGIIISDIHKMLTGETDDLVYLYKLKK